MVQNIVNRQGDVMLYQVQALPEGCIEQGQATEIVLAEGEQTGHKHTLLTEERPAITFLAPDGSVYLQIGEPATLTNEEHGVQTVQPGIYLLPQQVEYSPAAVRRVMD